MKDVYSDWLETLKFLLIKDIKDKDKRISAEVTDFCEGPCETRFMHVFPWTFFNCTTPPHSPSYVKVTHAKGKSRTSTNMFIMSNQFWLDRVVMHACIIVVPPNPFTSLRQPSLNTHEYTHTDMHFLPLRTTQGTTACSVFPSVHISYVSHSGTTESVFFFML